MSTAATLSMIKRRFAGSETDIERAFAGSESFRGLCRDYLACATALARWRDADSEEARVRVQEYTGLLRELTEEIRSHLPAARGEESGRAQGTQP